MLFCTLFIPWSQFHGKNVVFVRERVVLPFDRGIPFLSESNEPNGIRKSFDH